MASDNESITREEALRIWEEQADTNITVQSLGAVCHVLVNGVVVAWFSPFGAIVTRETMVLDASVYAQFLRKLTVALAAGQLDELRPSEALRFEGPVSPAPDGIIAEALRELRGRYEYWLTLRHTTDAERELATIKMQQIDMAMHLWGT